MNETGFKNGTLSSKQLSVGEIEALCKQSVIDPGGLSQVDGVTTADRPIAHRVIYIDRFDPALIESLQRSKITDVLVLAPEEYRDAISQPRLIVSRPGLLFIQIVRALFGYHQEAQTQTVAASATIDSSAKISVGVTVGAHSTIGAGAFIYPNVTIGDRVRIGRNCLVKSGSVVGQPGFRVYRDEGGGLHHMPHIAGVIVQDDVEIGALNSVASGTIHPTVLEQAVKTDDQVHIAHNCHIGARTVITASAELSGSVRVGNDCWIGPNASVRDGLTIGDRAVVGIGANVVKSVPPGVTVAGNPARERGPANSRG